MTERKRTKAEPVTVGTIVKAKRVTRPDGVTVTVAGGLFVLDVPGTFKVDRRTVKVEP